MFFHTKYRSNFKLWWCRWQLFSNYQPFANGYREPFLFWGTSTFCVCLYSTQKYSSGVERRARNEFFPSPPLLLIFLFLFAPCPGPQKFALEKFRRTKWVQERKPTFAPVFTFQWIRPFELQRRRGLMLLPVD